ncbi:hypothetical protein L210DRAFT_3506940 [Boletus edulis BED1]|uniref:Uncharacterized protein n=1 Tax=Boletus edulis BED1 TaxID=1328754 RepID=A0AAD4BLN5_BOLED|nr:hypothetical protein L210DRAFT_3506940 [Boletus edulis BED1]
MIQNAIGTYGIPRQRFPLYNWPAFSGWYGNLSLDVMQFWMDWHMMDSGKAFLPVDWWVLRLRAERCPGYLDERNQHHHQEVWFTRLTGHRPLSITNSRACISPTVFASPPKENQNLVYQVHDRLRMNEWIAFNRCIEREMLFTHNACARGVNPATKQETQLIPDGLGPREGGVVVDGGQGARATVANVQVRRDFWNASLFRAERSCLSVGVPFAKGFDERGICEAAQANVFARSCFLPFGLTSDGLGRARRRRGERDE